MAYFTLSQQISLARSLVTKAAPAYVQFYITARCNLACEQCNIIYGDAAAHELTVDEIKRVADNLARIGVSIVLLIGGEPFVRHDLPEIVRAFTASGIHVRLQTNGLATREAIERCVANGAHDISISLDTLRPAVQDVINGGFDRSWQRAIATIAVVSDIFPDNGTAFFNAVLMPRNFEDVPAVIEFATAIGWGVSLVPVHTTTADRPRGFRTIDDGSVVSFTPTQYPALRAMLAEISAQRDAGATLYDSDEYLDDVYRFVTGQPVRWRRRNGNVCDSPNLYFAIAPNGHMKVCCDYEMDSAYPVQDPRFPAWYFGGRLHAEAARFTRPCEGCMYGSYPEISITARYFGPMLSRFLYFNFKRPKVVRRSAQELTELAASIQRERDRRRAGD
jgi:MoaA/NifB/PqqE/SkfB family radical SAM enzyme